MSYKSQFRTCGGMMRKVGFIISPNYQWMGFALTAPFEIANRQAAEPVYDIRMLSKHGGPVRTSLGFQVLTEPFAEEPYDLIIVGASTEDASPALIDFFRPPPPPSPPPPSPRPPPFPSPDPA